MDLNAALVAKLLQKQAVARALTEEDLDEALRDVSTRLKALSDSIVDTMGRGQKAVGRKAGSLAASHLPEMYEGADLPDVLARMKKRFKGSFDFDATVQGNSEVTMTFPCCALGKVVEKNGEQIGTAVLCQTFHEYWAGLLGTFTSKNYSVEMTETGKRCTMKLAVR
jgi:predicted hydrocarbon binding protein